MRKKILIVDDEELNRELLRKIFEDEYDILMAENGKEAVRKIGKYSDEIAVILQYQAKSPQSHLKLFVKLENIQMRLR